MNTTIPTAGPTSFLLVTQIVGLTFRPFYRPEDMLNLGIKGGQFGHDDKILLYGINKDLTTKFKGTTKWAQDTYSNPKNYFNIANTQSERVLNNNNVYKAKHPLGWFEWYCRFYYGEKSTADMMRLSQWLIGINTAWFYIATDPARLTDLTWQPMRRQALLEWGVDPSLDPASYGCGEIL